MEPLPPDVLRVEDLTAEHLGGATPRELAAFRMAALQMELHLEVEERTAILVLLEDDAGWREAVAERVPLQWGLAHDDIDLRPPGMRAAESNRSTPGGPTQP